MQILPNGLCQFIDSSGAPLASGTVGFYAPGTLNPLTTFQDQAGTIPNTNPVLLNSRGQALIWGSGIYRQILKDASGVTIWDALTQSSDAAFSGSTGASLIGFDGTNLAVQLQTRINRVVDSIAALRALSKATYTRAWVTGYYAPHDGGGGAYQYDPADTTTADNGGTIIVASDGGRWKMQNFAYLTPEQFGAKGDGVTDDTVALQAAMNGLGTVARLTLSAKTYVYSNLTLPPSGIYLDGAGELVSGLLCNSPTGVITHSGTGTLQITNLNIGIKSGVTYTATGPLLNITGASQGHLIRKVLVAGGFGHISITNASIYDIEDCYFINYSAFSISISNVAAPDAGDSSITGNVFNANNTTGAAISQSSSGGMRISNNKFLGGAFHYLGQFNSGAANGTSILTFENNSSEHAQQSNVALNSSNNTAFSKIVIANNQFSVDPTSSSTGVVVQDPGYAWLDQLYIGGNVFSLGALAGQEALNIQRGTRISIDTNEIIGNNVENGIVIGAGVTSGTIAPQTMFNLANYWGGTGLANVKFSPGRREAAQVAGSMTSAYGSLFSSSLITVNFAQPYAVAPSVTVTPLVTNGAVSCVLASVGTTGFTFNIIGVTNSVTTQAFWEALG